MTYDIKGGISNRESQAYIAAVGAGTTDKERPIFIAPGNCIVRKVSITPQATLERSDTYHHTFYVYDKGASGTGSDVIISGSTMNTPSGGQSILAFNELDIADITGGTYSTTNTILSAGDVVSFKNASGGTTVALPEMLIKVVYELTDLKEPAY